VTTKAANIFPTASVKNTDRAAKNSRTACCRANLAFSFKGKNATAQEIGEKLGVAHLVEGSVRKAGDVVRIAAGLLRPTRAKRNGPKITRAI